MVLRGLMMGMSIPPLDEQGADCSFADEFDEFDSDDEKVS